MSHDQACSKRIVQGSYGILVKGLLGCVQGVVTSTIVHTEPVLVNLQQ